MFFRYDLELLFLILFISNKLDEILSVFVSIFPKLDEGSLLFFSIFKEISFLPKYEMLVKFSLISS